MEPFGATLRGLNCQSLQGMGEEKFASLAEPILGGTTTRDLIGEIARFDALGDLRGVMRMCGT